MKTSFWTMLLMTGVVEVALPQPPSTQLMMYSLSEQTGLSDNRVTCVFQDSKGFMWIGTQDGLNLFDGSVIRNFKSKLADTTSDLSDHITAIAEGRNGNLWITTFDGLKEFDPGKRTFTYHKPEFHDKSYLMRNLQFDSAENIWIASELGLIQYLIKEKKFVTHTNLAHNDVSLRTADNWLTDILIDREHRFWLCTRNGLWQFFPEKDTFHPVTISANPQLVFTAFEDHQGKIWFGSWLEGLKVYDPESKQVTRIEGNIPVNVEGIAEAKDLQGQYNIWCSGLAAVHPDGKVERFDPKPPETASDYFPSKFYAAHDGLLWITTMQGVRIMAPSRQFFSHFFPTKNAITSQGIAVAEKGNNLYVGGKGSEFLKLYDSSFQLVRQIHSPPINSDFAILSIVREDATKIWLCTESGLILFDEKTGIQRKFLLTEKECDSPARNFFLNMLIDSKGTHWVFPWRGGIWQLDKSSGKFKRILLSLSKSNAEKRRLVVSSAAEDENGNIWFADLDDGLILYDRKTRSFSKPAEKIISPDFQLQKVLPEKPYLWFVITGQVLRIHSTTHQIDRWKVPEDFNKSVNDFCQDREGNIWITTTSGLLAFNKVSHTFNRFTVFDGLISDNMEGTITSLDNGKIVFGQGNHFTVFNPKVLLNPSLPSRVVITELASQNRRVEIQQNKAGEKLMDMDYSQNNFRFQWALLNYSNPLQNKYYCKMSGIDDDWKYVGHIGQAEYANLAPGKYVFKVRGTTSDGVRNESDDQLFITIEPPFWKTSWFISISAFAICALLYSFYRYRLNQILLHERLRGKISTDLHDDIGSTLSSISILGDLVLQKTSNEETSAMVREIRDNAQTLMDKMDDIVWGINPDNDSLEKLMLRTKRFASQLFDARNIEYTIDIQRSIQHLKLPMDYRQHIYLILKESINNMIKHAGCSRASIAISSQDRSLEIVIKDNGKGFDPDSAHSGNGLNSIKRRAESMKAELKIESNPSQGSSIHLKVKIK